MSTSHAAAPQGKLFGHPTGLFTLFFAEMWERFSYYGMRALLVFYMTKGFLGYGDKQAYEVYGAYTALVYMTPYFGGMLADKVLGQRRAVVLGGLLMAAGHLLMTIETKEAFFGALALLIAGNGFFKPNISTIVGTLYPKAEEGKKDGGFTIFYMGINLGAAMSPVLCGYVGETYGWHYGFGLATIGMLIGIAVFVAPTRLTQALILTGALGTAIAMPFLQDSLLQLLLRIFLAVSLTTAGVVAFVALGRGGLPKEAGQPRHPEAASRKLLGFLRADLAILLGTGVAVVIFTQLVQRNKVTGVMLVIVGIVALGYILYEAFARSTKIEAHRLFVVLILMFFSLLFWAFFEQAGSSITNFTDRNVNRVFPEKVLVQADVGQTIEMRVLPTAKDPEIAKLPLLSQAQLGYANADPSMRALIEKAVRSEEEKRAKLKPEEIEQLVAKVNEQKVFTLTGMSALRGAAGREGAAPELQKVSWQVAPENVGMGIAISEVPASEFQAVNPVYILIFGLVFSALWSFLAARKREPTTTVKFALGLLQLGLGFGALWYGAKTADGRGMTALVFLLLAYLLHTTGELCLSPVGLSMVTKLSPARMASTVMGAWFLATSFSSFLAGTIATLTGVSGEEGGEQIIPPPSESIHVYGGVFGQIALIAIVSAVICFALSPLLTKWMHPEAGSEGEATGGGGH